MDVAPAFGKIGRGLLASTLVLTPALALAAEGPWTTPSGLQEVYLGTGIERFEAFDTGNGSTQDVPYPVYRAGGKVFWRYGINSNLDVALDAPLLTSFAPDAPASSSKFATTTSFEYLKTRLRVRLPSEGLPVDLAARAELRTGVLHRETRSRLTNLGEGTTDLGGTLSTGSMGLVGGFFYTFAVDAGYWYRFPLEQGDDGKIPGDEVLVSSFLQITPSEHLGFALMTDSFWRLSGEDFGETEVEVKDNEWAALRAAQTKVGGKLIVYPDGAWPQFVVSFARAVWARNNPVDTTVVELGIGFNLGNTE
ncbi:MAG: hypothetical protein QGG40_10570 [Myxococcota bacterium]|nr:hypothetical protein [Myxococcota bacterium]